MSLIARLMEAGTPADLIEEVAMVLAEKKIAEQAIEERKRKANENTSRYRARGGGKVPAWQRREVFERDDWKCVECGSEENLQCDHILPLSKGGGNEPENLQTLCRPCNARKRDRIRKADKRGQTRTEDDSAGTERDVTDAPLSPSLSPQTPQTHPHTPGDNTRARKAEKFPMPDFCRDPQTWRDFLDNRKTKRLPCTPSAHAKLIRDVHKLADEEWPPWKVFDEIVARGWGAAYEFRDERKPKNDNRKQPNSGRNTAQLALQKLGSRQ